MYGGSSSIKLSTDEDENRLSQNELNTVYSEQMKFQELGKKNIHSSVIWGDADEIVPIDGLSYLKSDYPNTNYKVVKNGHHDITYALPSIVGKFLSEQLQS